jgi:cytochrome bd-type quinol oxidase subunit 2
MSASSAPRPWTLIAVVVLVGWVIVTALLFPVTGADEHEGPGNQVWRTSSSALGVPLSPEWDVLVWLAALVLVPVVVVGLAFLLHSRRRHTAPVSPSPGGPAR